MAASASTSSSSIHSTVDYGSGVSSSSFAILGTAPLLLTSTKASHPSGLRIEHDEDRNATYLVSSNGTAVTRMGAFSSFLPVKEYSSQGSLAVYSNLVSDLVRYWISGIHVSLMVFCSADARDGMRDRLFFGERMSRSRDRDPVLSKYIFELLIQEAWKSMRARHAGTSDSTGLSSSSSTSTAERSKFTFHLESYCIFDETVTDLLDPHAGPIAPNIDDFHPQFGPSIVGNRRAPFSNPNSLVATVQECIHRVQDRDSLLTETTTDLDRTHIIFKFHLVQIAPEASDSLQSLDSETIKSPASIVSTFSIILVSPVDPLCESEEIVNRREGVSVNRSLFSFRKLLESLSSHSSRMYADYSGSILTRLLRDSVGGNSLTRGLFLFSQKEERDMEMAVQLGNLGFLLSRTEGFPLINDDRVRGLLHLYRLELKRLYSTLRSIRSKGMDSGGGGEDYAHGSDERSIVDNLPSDTPAAALRKLHDLEGQLIRRNLERLQAEEEKEKLLLKMSEMKEKLGNCVEEQRRLEENLLQMEEEKLQVTKAFIDARIQVASLQEKVSGSSFDEETRILAAETAAAEAESRLTQSKQEIDSLTVELENVKSDRKDLAAEYVALKHNFNAIHRDFAVEKEKIEELQLEIVNLLNANRALREELALCGVSQPGTRARSLAPLSSGQDRRSLEPQDKSPRAPPLSDIGFGVSNIPVLKTDQELVLSQNRVSQQLERIADLESQIQLLQYQNSLLADEVTEKDNKYREKLREAMDRMIELQTRAASAGIDSSTVQIGLETFVRECYGNVIRVLLSSMRSYELDRDRIRTQANVLRQQMLTLVNSYENVSSFSRRCYEIIKLHLPESVSLQLVQPQFLSMDLIKEIRRQSNVEMTLQDELRRTADELRDAHMQIAQTEQTHGLYRRHVEATISALRERSVSPVPATIEMSKAPVSNSKVSLEEVNRHLMEELAGLNEELNALRQSRPIVKIEKDDSRIQELTAENERLRTQIQETQFQGRPSVEVEKLQRELEAERSLRRELESGRMSRNMGNTNSADVEIYQAELTEIKSERDQLLQQVQDLQKRNPIAMSEGGYSEDYVTRVRKSALEKQQELEKKVYEWQSRATMAEGQVKELESYLAEVMTKYESELRALRR